MRHYWSDMPGNVKWSLLGSLLIYLGLVITRNTRLKYSSKELAAARKCCHDIDDRIVDISDSRLSNFDSDSSDRELDTSELLTVDRVFPLTSTLNGVMDKILRKLALQLTLGNKQILSLENDQLNLTYLEDECDKGTERSVFGRNAFLSRLDSLQANGNAYITEDSDTKITIVQKLRFKILKHSFDFYDDNSTFLGGSSFIYNNNTFLLSIVLSTNYDNSECRVKSVNFTYVPDGKPLALRVEGLSGSEHFYKKFKSSLSEHFITKVPTAVEHELLPVLSNLVHQANICSYFDAKHKPTNSNSVNLVDNDTSVS